MANPWSHPAGGWQIRDFARERPRRRSQQGADGLSLTSSCTDVGFNNIKPRLPEV